MKTQAVHWHEGMFLRPHHFQMAQRYWGFLASQGNSWDLHYGWGIRAIDIDEDALMNFRCVVRRVQARLRDGTIININDGRLLPPVDLSQPFRQSSTVTIYLAVPMLRSGQSNLQEEDSERHKRFGVKPVKIHDENTGTNAQVVQVRHLNVQLLISLQETLGYEILPLAKFRLTSDATPAPQLVSDYFPPVLNCEAWKPLHFSILHNLCERIGKKIELLAKRVVDDGITFDTEGEGDQQTLLQLHELNQAATSLDYFRKGSGIHPVWLYEELCRIIGKLAIFGEERRPPTLPHYDHDDLGGCLSNLKQLIDEYLNAFVEPEYKQRGFVGSGSGLLVNLDPAWLEPGWDMYIAVKSKLDPARVTKMLNKGGTLNMKIGSRERADIIFKFGSEGLQFTHVPNPPRLLPGDADLVYFQIIKESSSKEWSYVRRSLTLGIRLNMDLISGEIQGKRAIMIRVDDETVTFHLTLYVIEN